MKILVLIPAYNESRCLGKIITAVRNVAPDCHILVVNDGSRDDTAVVAGRAGATVISHPFNMGYGVAIQTGYKYAIARGYDHVVQMDGDGQHDPAWIPGLLLPVVGGETDFVIGSRFLEPGSYRPPLVRRMGMAFFRSLVSRLIGCTITDSTSGYQAFNRRVTRFFTGDSFPCDYPDADMLITLHRHGFRIAEVPVRMQSNEAGTSMHGGLKPLYYLFKMLLSIAVTLLRKKEPRT